MVGVKKGALNFPKMLRALGHRTNQVRKLGFYRSPLYESAVATTKDVDKDGIRETRLRGPAVNFGYTETQSMSKSIPDWSEGKTYYETTWALNFPNSLNSLQVPKISGDSTTGLTGQTSKGTCDFYVPSYKIINGLSGFGGNQTDGGRAASVVFGKTANPGQGEFGGYQTVGQMFGPNYHNDRYGDDIAVTDEILEQLHWARWPPQRTVAGQLEDFYPTTHEGVKSPAIELKVGDVICADSHENRQYETNSQQRAIVNDVTDGAYWSRILSPIRYTAYDSEADRIGDYANYRVPPDGETITITDGHGTSVTFEFDVAGNGAAGSNTAITGGDNIINLAAAICDAVNASSLDVTALNYIPARDGHPDSPYFILGGNTNKKTAQLFLQQNVAGVSGQTAITVSGQVTAQYFGFDRDRPSESNYGPAEGNTDGDNTRLYSLSSTDWDGNKRGFDTEAPELILIKSIEGYHNHPDINEGDAAPTVESHATSNVTQVGVVRGYNGTTPRTSQKLPGRYGWSNHDPFWYLVKRGYAFAILDVQNSGSVDETITLVSTDGTSKTYTCKATADYANNQWSRAGADHGVASFKAAVEHANGHDGKIAVELKSYTGGYWTVILTQSTSGTAGNTTITEGLTGYTITNQFVGGLEDTNTIESGTTLTIKDAEGSSHTFTTDNTLKEWESTSTKIGTNLTCQNPDMWAYALSVAIHKAARVDLTYLKNTRQSDINEQGDSVVELLESTYPFTGSEETAKINIGWVPTDAAGSFTYNMSNGKNGLFGFEWTYGDEFGYAQYNKVGEDLYNDWSNRTMVGSDDTSNSTDASGLLYNTFEFTLWYQGGAFTVHQNSIGELGNTEITGNSPCFSNVGNWWSGVIGGHPGEQSNRSFHNGQSFKGKYIQTRINDTHYQGPRQNLSSNYKLVEPYFYEFLTGDLIQDTSHVVFRGTDVLNCYPKSHGINRTSIQGTGIGFTFQDAGLAEGRYLSGVEADRIKFKVSLSAGQEDANIKIPLGGTDNHGSWRGWNQYRGSSRDFKEVDYGQVDNSVSFKEIEFIYTLDNILYKNTIYLGKSGYINMVPGETYEFDLPLDKNNSEIYYLYSPDNWFDPESADSGNSEHGGHGNVLLFDTKMGERDMTALHRNDKGDLTPGRNFFPLWINGAHYIAEMKRGVAQYKKGFNSGAMLDVSTGAHYQYSEDKKKLATPNYSMRRCTGQKGSCLGRDGQGFERYENQSYSSYRNSKPKGGWNDIQFIDRDGFNHKVRMDFKDIKIYKPKTWRIETAREYDSEYVKLSCRRIGQGDNSVKRRAYGK